MSATLETNDRTEIELRCPIPGCEYTHTSVQGITAHVGNGHDRGWHATDATPRDVHEEGTNAHHDTLDRAERIRGYLARCDALSDGVRVFYHWGYGNVQIALEGYLNDHRDAFRDAVNVEGIHYAGDGLYYCDEEFVLQLPEAPVTDVIEPVACGMTGCSETNDLTRLRDPQKGSRTACRSCRKAFFEVTT